MEQLLEWMEITAGYKKSMKKAHGQIEIRKYYQTEGIGFMPQRKQWKDLKSIGLEKKIVCRDGKEEKEYRYYISSLKMDIGQFSRAGSWVLDSRKHALAPRCDIP